MSFVKPEDRFDVLIGIIRGIHNHAEGNGGIVVRLCGFKILLLSGPISSENKVGKVYPIVDAASTLLNMNPGEIVPVAS